MDTSRILKSFAGFGLCGASALSISIANVIVKHLAHVDSFLLSCIRYWTIFMITSPISLRSVQNDEKGKNIFA